MLECKARLACPYFSARVCGTDMLSYPLKGPSFVAFRLHWPSALVFAGLSPYFPSLLSPSLSVKYIKHYPLRTGTILTYCTNRESYSTFGGHRIIAYGMRTAVNSLTLTLVCKLCIYVKGKKSTIVSLWIHG